MSEERRMKSEEVKGIPINCGIACTPVTPDSCTPERDGERSEPLLLLIEEFIDEHYRVRLNTLSQQYEVCERGTERWAPVSGTLCNRILMELNREGVIPGQTHQKFHEISSLLILYIYLISIILYLFMS